jgi:hypothetical protein
MKTPTLAITVAAAFLCAAVFAGSRAFHVSRDRQMERFYERAIQFDRAQRASSQSLQDEFLASPEFRFHRDKQRPLPMAEHIDALSQFQRENQARLEAHRAERERQTTFWLGLMVLAGVFAAGALLLSFLLRNRSILALARFP